MLGAKKLLCRKPSQTVESVSDGLRHLGGECDRSGAGYGVWGTISPSSPRGSGSSTVLPRPGEEVRFHCRSPCVVSVGQKNKRKRAPWGPSLADIIVQTFWSCQLLAFLSVPLTFAASLKSALIRGLNFTNSLADRDAPERGCVALCNAAPDCVVVLVLAHWHGREGR